MAQVAVRCPGTTSLGGELAIFRSSVTKYVFENPSSVPGDTAA